MLSTLVGAKTHRGLAVSVNHSKSGELTPSPSPAPAANSGQPSSPLALPAFLSAPQRSPESGLEPALTASTTPPGASLLESMPPGYDHLADQVEGGSVGVLAAGRHGAVYGILI